MKKLIFILSAVLFFFSCTHQKKTATIAASPFPPDTLALHFWDKSDFKKVDLINHNEAIESMFMEYLQTLNQANQSTRKTSIDIVLDKIINDNPALLGYFVSLFDKYLYNPNSPIRNEELYMFVLQYLSQSPAVDETNKMRYSSRLAMLSKNRVGEIATDFEYILRNGKKNKLSNIEAEYIIIFFNNPDCHDCARVKNILSSTSYPGVKILAIYPDKDLSVWEKTVYPESWINGYNNETISQLYDLKAIPTLYLLDRNKRIILKDAPVEEIIRYCVNTKNNYYF
ncbi:MAG: DUF5106 domain-containing protein [Candidatus Azobacteroides sp.]|nr:DUF5106 domain-containing protein [Candidatus Azobacteroides sp.]